MANGDALSTEYVEVRLDTSQAEAEADRSGRRIGESLERGVGNNLGKNLARDMRAQFRAINADLKKQIVGPVKIAVNAKATRTELQRTLSRMRPVKIPVTFDSKQLARSLRSAARVKPIKIPVRYDTKGAKLPKAPRGGGGAAAGLANPASIAAIGAAALAAAGHLAPLAGALAAIPAAITTVTAAVVPLKVALLGVGDAFKAAATGSSEEFKESLKGLAPAAQDAAREVRALGPAWREAMRGIQGAFWAQLAGDITKTSRALQGPLRTGLSGIAAEWGKAASGVLEYLRSTDGIANIKSILAGTKSVIAGLGNGLRPLVQGFLDLAGAITQAFGAKVGSGLENTLSSIGAWLTKISESGQATAWVQGAVDTFRDLVAAAKPVIGIISDVAGALAGGQNEGSQSGSALQDFARNMESIRSGLQVVLPLIRGLASAGQSLNPLTSAISAITGAVGGMRTAWTGFTTWFQQLPGQFTGWLSGIGTSISTAFTNGTTAAWTTILGWGARVAGWFQGLPARIGGALAGLGAAVTARFRGIWGGARAAVTSGINTIVGFFRGLPGKAGAALAGLAQSLRLRFEAAKAAARMKAMELVTATVQLIRGLPGKASNALSSLGRAVSDKINAARGSASSAAKAVVNAAVEPFRGIYDAISNAIGDLSGLVSSRVNSALSGIPSWARGAVPFLADGAILTRPTLNIAGEAGKEAVIPLTKHRRAQQLARQSGLDKIIASDPKSAVNRGKDHGGGHTTNHKEIHNHFHIEEAKDGHDVANRIMRRVAYSAAL